MKDITKWWIDYQPLDDNEKTVLNAIIDDKPIFDDKEFNIVKKKLFERMPCCNISEKTHHISFSSCATDFINALFEKYADDETLVIHSNNEHDNVKLNLKKCKNTLEVDYYNEIIPLKIHRIINEAKKYKRVFIYIIGTQISTGEITPQLFFERLKQQMTLSSINHIIVLDDVHGMFLTPRDYSIFDYVLNTAHALIANFGMGIMISKNNLFGINAVNWGNTYLHALDVMLKRDKKLKIFSQVMRDEFYEYLLMDGFDICKYTTPHIFSLKVNNVKFTNQMYNKLKDYSIKVEGINDVNTYIRFRAQHYIQCPQYLIDGLQLVHNIISSSMGYTE